MNAEDEVEKKDRTPLLLGLLGCAVVLAGFVYWAFFTTSFPTAESMARQALTASDPKARHAAARQLSGLQLTEDAWQAMYRVAKESKDPEVVGCVLPRLVVTGINEFPPLVFEKMEDPDEKMRLAAAAALSKMHSKLPDGLVYDPKGPAEERGKVRRALEKRHNDMMKKAAEEVANEKK